jgi:hypothetical protein
MLRRSQRRRRILPELSAVLPVFLWTPPTCASASMAPHHNGSSVRFRSVRFGRRPVRVATARVVKPLRGATPGCPDPARGAPAEPIRAGRRSGCCAGARAGCRPVPWAGGGGGQSPTRALQLDRRLVGTGVDDLAPLRGGDHAPDLVAEQLARYDFEARGWEGRMAWRYGRPRSRDARSIDQADTLRAAARLVSARGEPGQAWHGRSAGTVHCPIMAVVLRL